MNSAAFEDFWTRNVPFADWHYIRSRLTPSVKRHLELSLQLFPSARAVHERLTAEQPTEKDHAWQHPFLRALVFSSAMHVVGDWEFMSRETIESVFKSLDVELQRESSAWQSRSLTELLVEGSEPAEPPHTVWLWQEDDLAPPISRVIASLFYRSSPSYRLLSPSRQQVASASRGVQLLRELFPALAASVLRHIDVVALAAGEALPSGKRALPEFTSYSCDTCPGVIFLSPVALSNPWFTAEVVLHEGLHTKLYDIRATHSLFRRGSAGADWATFHPVWHPSSERWDADRGLFAMHVYVHLAEFYERIAARFTELEAAFGPLHVCSAQVARQRAHDRAYFLGSRLLQECRVDLGAAGELLVSELQAWITHAGAGETEAQVTRRIVSDFYQRQSSAMREDLSKRNRSPNLLGSIAVLGELTAQAAALLGADERPLDLVQSPSQLLELRRRVEARVNEPDSPIDTATLQAVNDRTCALLRGLSIPVDLNP